MARVKYIQIDEVSKEIRPIYKKFIENYGCLLYTSDAADEV